MHRRIPVICAVAVLCLGTFAVHGARKPKPRVLIIGDSVCTYYTPFAKREIGSIKAEVRKAGHMRDTRFGLEHVQKYLDKGPWAVIHFNWGLHDLKKRGKQVPVEEYEKNLRRIVQLLKRSGAKLIFATTTPVGPRAARRNSDVIAYNDAAKRVMKAERVTVNDVYALIHPQRSKLQLRDGVHFSEKGNRIIGEAVADSILEALKERTD